MPSGATRRTDVYGQRALEMNVASVSETSPDRRKPLRIGNSGQFGASRTPSYTLICEPHSGWGRMASTGAKRQLCQRQSHKKILSGANCRNNEKIGGSDSKIARKCPWDGAVRLHFSPWVDFPREFSAKKRGSLLAATRTLQVRLTVRYNMRCIDQRPTAV